MRSQVVLTFVAAGISDKVPGVRTGADNCTGSTQREVLVLIYYVSGRPDYTYSMSACEHVWVCMYVRTYVCVHA